MKGKKHEEGYALVLVIALTLLFTTLGLGLLAMNINASKQFSMKEEQVQARHQAEMGVLHYKNELESYILSHKTKDNILCSDVPLEINPISPAENYSYKVKLNSINPCISNEDGLLVKIISEGNTHKKAITKTIEAEFHIINSGGKGTGNSDENPSNKEVVIPIKPPYPEPNWGYKPSVSTLDDIKGNSPFKVVHGVTSKEPLIVEGFTELVGSLDVNKKSNWTFNNHLLVAGSMATNTAGNNVSEIITKKDLFIGGALHVKNHTIINVEGNFIVEGDVDFGTKTNLTVKGDALFNNGVSEVDTHSNIVIEKNAFFKKKLGGVKNNANFCVRGQAYLWKNAKWSPYSKSDEGYYGLNQNCLGTAEEEKKSNWEVMPDINVNYK